MTIHVTSPDFAAGEGKDLLLCALERATRTPWRRVGQNIAVERVEPYRTLVLRSEALQRWHEQCRCEQSFEFHTELCTPLASAGDDWGWTAPLIENSARYSQQA